MSARRTRYYVLDDDNRVQPVDDAAVWARLFAGGRDRARPFLSDQVAPGVLVSTTFTGIDARCGAGAPLVFESQVFGLGGALVGLPTRYASWDEATCGHGALCAALRARLAAIDAELAALLGRRLPPWWQDNSGLEIDEL